MSVRFPLGRLPAMSVAARGAILARGAYDRIKIWREWGGASCGACRGARGPRRVCDRGAGNSVRRGGLTGVKAGVTYRTV